MKEIKRLAVQKVNVAVHVKEFLNMNQDADEPVRKYHARLRCKALSCEFTTTGEVRCTCGITNRPKISYMDDVIRHKLVTGLADADIMQDVLATEINHWKTPLCLLRVRKGARRVSNPFLAEDL